MKKKPGIEDTYTWVYSYAILEQVKLINGDKKQYLPEEDQENRSKNKGSFWGDGNNLYLDLKMVKQEWILEFVEFYICLKSAHNSRKNLCQ